MVLSEDKESYLVVADTPEPAHASLLLTTTQSTVTQWTLLSALAWQQKPTIFPGETCMISEHIFHVLQSFIRAVI